MQFAQRGDPLDRFPTFTTTRYWRIKRKCNRQFDDCALKNYVILNKEFNEKVNYTVLIPIDKISILNGYQYKIIGKEYIEKVEN